MASLAANWLEIIAVTFGLVSVWLTTREHIVSWPTAIVNVAIFFFLFWKARLYADAVLQLFYLSLSVYGWWAWLRAGPDHSALHVSRATRRHWVIGIPIFLIFGLGLGVILDKYTDSPVPFFDALLTSASLVAQWMMTRKILENWIVWIAANLVYVPLMFVRGLPFTAIQYTVFTVLAVQGYRSWKRSWVHDHVAAVTGIPAPVAPG